MRFKLDRRGFLVAAGASVMATSFPELRTAVAQAGDTRRSDSTPAAGKEGYNPRDASTNMEGLSGRMGRHRGR